MARKSGEAQAITEVAPPLRDDIARRTRRYLIQMAIRTACFLAAVIGWGRWPGWLVGLAVLGAVVLPYVAVLGANAGHEPRDLDPTFVDPRAIEGLR